MSSPSEALLDSDALIAGRGRTGDVIRVDIAALLGGSRFTIRGFGPGTTYTVHPQRGDLSVADAWGENLGTVILSDRFLDRNFSETGQLYFAPNAVGSLRDGDSTRDGFQGIVSIDVEVDGVLQTVRIWVDSGYTTEGENAITFGTSILEVARLQQRLNFLGFRDSGGQSLVIDGILGPLTTHAIGVFNSAIWETSHPTEIEVESRFIDVARDYINSPNAPRWVTLEDTPGVVMSNEAAETSATHWRKMY